MINKYLVIALAGLIFTFDVEVSSAQVSSSWNGTTGNWSDATRWSTDPLFPNNGNGENDYNAVINGGTVTLDQEIEIEGLALDNATINGDFDLTLKDMSNWSSGTMEGSGVTTIGSEGSLAMIGVDQTRNLNRILVNDGSTTWTGGNLSLVNGTFQNNAEFLVDASLSDLFIYSQAGTNAFNNAGTFTKTGAGTVTFVRYGGTFTFNNSGTVDVQEGSLLLLGGDHTGTFTGAVGTSLQFGGNHNFAAGADISGGMNVNFSGGTATLDSQLTTTGTVNIQGTVAIEAGHLEAPTVNLSGTVTGSGDWDVDDDLNWTLGTMAGSGVTTIGSEGTLAIIGNQTRNLNRILVNDGSTTWTDGNLSLVNGTIQNNADFLADASSSDMFIYSQAGTNAFNNAGTFTKTGTGAVTFVSYGGTFTFNNSGTVDVEEGSLLLLGGDHAGTFTGAVGTTLQFGGNHNFAAGADISGGMNVNFSGGTHNFNGTLDTTGTVNVGSGGSFQLNGGMLKAEEMTFSGGSASFSGGRVAVGTIHGNLGVQGATVSPGGPGNIGTTNVVYGSVLPNYSPSSTSTLEIDFAGLDSFDQLNVEGIAYLNGTLDLSYLPELGELNNQTFRILTASSIVGTFDTLQGNLFDNGTVMPIYGDDYVDLLVSFDPPPAPTPVLNEVRKLTASDTAFDDAFGRHVAISGNIAIIGARRDDTDVDDSGSAYLFDVTTGQELFKLTASDAGEGDLFGASVAIDGNVAIVGDPYSDSAYLFDVTTGQELFKLAASDAAELNFFGESVAIDGNVAIVGAFVDDSAGQDSGSAYLFDVTTGEQLSKLMASDPEFADYFGFSVALSGNIAVVGAPTGFIDGGLGAAHVFDVTSGEELYQLITSDAYESQSAEFGYAVAIDGNKIIGGSYYLEAAYIFELPLPGDPLSGDFDGDGAVGGRDFLLWQRNPSVGNLADWQTNYGEGSLTASVTVPEPTSLLLSVALFAGVALRRK